MILKQTILDLINNNIRNKLPKVIKSEHANVEEALLNAVFIPYQVIELDCPQQFIDDNFDLAPGSTMGLGKNLMLGFAMSNGNNGTQDRRRRTSVAYDPRAYVSGHNYSIMGNTFGEETHQLTIEEMPKHDHVLPSDLSGGADMESVVSSGGSDEGFGNDGVKTAETGGVQAHNNMQPSIVTLVIQRI